MNINPYPLLWPERHPRTPRERRRSSTFRVSLDQAAREAKARLKDFGATEIVMTSMARTELGGTTDLGNDPGVAIWFLWRKVQRCFACDSYSDLRSNVRAIGLSVEAMQSMERYSAQMLEQFMSATNVDALPAVAGDSSDWFAGCNTKEQIKTRHSELAVKHHPDLEGGDGALMAEINAARDRKLKELE